MKLIKIYFSLFFFSLFFLVSCNSYFSVQKSFVKRSGYFSETVYKINKRRHFINLSENQPESEINNRAVSLALDGYCPEAEVLLLEIYKSCDRKIKAAACNNLGIVYECSGNGVNAFDMYSTACMLAPKNMIFRENFLSFVDSPFVK